jgi:hypothetical protein
MPETMLAVEEPTTTTTIVLAVIETETAQQREESTSTKINRPAQTSVGIDVKEYMDAVLNWERPISEDGHWPPYRDFVGKDYDPNRWEGFAQYELQLESSETRSSHQLQGTRILRSIGSQPFGSAIHLHRHSLFISGL